MGWQKLWNSLGEESHLQKSSQYNTYFGRYNFYPAQIIYLPKSKGNGESISLDVHFQGHNLLSIEKHIEDEFKARGLKFQEKWLEINGTHIGYNIRKGLFGNPNRDQLQSMLEALTKGVENAGLSPRVSCHKCEKPSIEVPLVDGALEHTCSTCMAKKMRSELREVKKIDEKNFNYNFVFTIGLIGCFLGALLWGGLSILTQSSYISLGAAVGVGIAKLMMRYTKTKNLTVYGGIIGLSIGSLILGDLIFYGYLIDQSFTAQGIEASTFDYIRGVFFILFENLRDAIVAILCGVAGAVYGIKHSANSIEVPFLVEWSDAPDSQEEEEFESGLKLAA